MLDIDDEIEALLNDIASSIVERAKRNIMVTRKRQGARGSYTSATNTTGKLRDSLRYRVINKGGVPEMRFYTKGGTQNYADVVEWGRRAGAKAPPSESLIQWIKDKKIKPRDANGKFIKVNNEESWRRGLAFVIGRKIAKSGYKGIHYWRDAIDAELEIRGKDIANAIEKYVIIKINQGWL